MAIRDGRCFLETSRRPPVSSKISSQRNMWSFQRLTGGLGEVSEKTSRISNPLYIGVLETYRRMWGLCEEQISLSYFNNNFVFFVIFLWLPKNVVIFAPANSRRINFSEVESDVGREHYIIGKCLLTLWLCPFERRKLKFGIQRHCRGRHYG